MNVVRASQFGHGFETFDAFRDGAVDILLREGFRGRRKYHGLLYPSFNRRFHTLQVGHQCRVGNRAVLQLGQCLKACQHIGSCCCMAGFMCWLPQDCQHW